MTFQELRFTLNTIAMQNLSPLEEAIWNDIVRYIDLKEEFPELISWETAGALLVTLIEDAKDGAFEEWGSVNLVIFLNNHNIIGIV